MRSALSLGDPDPLKRRLFDSPTDQAPSRCGPRFSLRASLSFVLRLLTLPIIGPLTMVGRRTRRALWSREVSRDNADNTTIQLRSNDLRMLICDSARQSDPGIDDLPSCEPESLGPAIRKQLAIFQVSRDLLRKSLCALACFGYVSESSRCCRPVPLSTPSISPILSLSFTRSFSLSFIIIIIIIQTKVIP